MSATNSKPLEADTNKVVVFPQVKNNAIERFTGAVNVDGIHFDLELTPATAKNSTSYWQVNGTERNPKDGAPRQIRGAVFEREKKTDKSPDLSGPIEINSNRPDEIKKQLTIWLATSAGGKSYGNGHVEEPYRKPAA